MSRRTAEKAEGAELQPVNEITEAIIVAAIAVHRRFGPGLFERTYEASLARHLTSQGLRVERQVALPVVYLGETVKAAYRVDMLVERQVVVELKTVEKLHPMHVAQVVTYLRLAELQVGLLINFNVARITDGLRRVVNGYRSASAPSAASAALRDKTVEPLEGMKSPMPPIAHT